MLKKYCSKKLLYTQGVYLLLFRFGKRILSYMNTDISFHEAWFDAYVSQFCEAEQSHKGILELKIQHTHLVLQHMRSLVQEETVLQKYARACLLAALYHDVARFVQFARWGTFKDSCSTNHGLLGIKILKQYNCLQYESPLVQRQVLAAVGMHNRFAIPKRVSKDIFLITTAVRDADKLDILRVMAAHFTKKTVKNDAVVLHVKSDPQGWTQKVVDAVLGGRVALYTDLVYENDFKLLLGTWIHELFFITTARALAKTNYITEIIKDLPCDTIVQEAKKYIEHSLSALLQGA